MSYEIAYPFSIDARGRTAAAGDDRHLRDLIEQVLFTTPGERVHRPDFGCGLLQLVFDPTSDALLETARMTVQGALQRWLGDRIQVDRVTLSATDGAVRVRVAYRPRTGGESRVVIFERET